MGWPLMYVVTFIVVVQLIVLHYALKTLRAMEMVMREQGLHLAALNKVNEIHQEHLNELSREAAKRRNLWMVNANE